MPLTETKGLIEKFRSVLQTGFIESSESLMLKEAAHDLLCHRFGYSQLYNEKLPISDSNHTPKEAKFDFVRALSQEKWFLGNLHTLNTQIIQSFHGKALNSPCLILSQAFLACEILYDPAKAALHFETEEMKRLFPTAEKMNEFKYIYLYEAILGLKVLEYSEISSSKAQFLIISGELQNQLSKEKPEIEKIVRQLIEGVTEKWEQLDHSIIFTWLLRNTLYVLQGRISVEKYISDKDYSWLDIKMVPPSYKEQLGGVALLGTSLAVFTTTSWLGGMVPSLVLLERGLAQFGPKMKSTGIQNSIKQLSNIILAEINPREPTLYETSEAASSSIFAQSQLSRDSFFGAAAGRKVEILGRDEDYDIVNDDDYLDLKSRAAPMISQG